MPRDVVDVALDRLEELCLAAKRGEEDIATVASLCDKALPPLIALALMECDGRRAA